METKMEEPLIISPITLAYYLMLYFIVASIMLFFYLGDSQIIVECVSIGQLNKTSKLFFGIVSMESSVERRTLMKSIWTENIISKGHDYVYITDNKISDTTKWTPTVQFLGKSNNANRNREYKRLTAAKYFIENTSADFLLIPTDDVFVDVNRINELAHYLSNKYKTEEEIVFLGNCINFPNVKFLQGGSGYILSRAGAREFLKYGKKWCQESSQPDDVETARFLGYIGKEPKDCSVQFMSGHPFSQLQNENFNSSNLPKCPKYYDSGCNNGVTPLRKLYMMHPPTNMKLGVTAWNNFQRILKEDREYGWYSVSGTNYICVL